jgi:hypothetical protein
LGNQLQLLAGLKGLLGGLQLMRDISQSVLLGLHL